MKYQYSHLIDPSSYDSQGLSDGIPLRCHRNSDTDRSGSNRLRNDWQKHVGPLSESIYGGLGPLYSFTAVTIPECLPDRLEIVAYTMEFAFLHDDLVDSSESDGGLALYDKIMADINAEFRDDKSSSGSSGEARILRGIIEEMSAIDASGTKEFLAWWKVGVSLPRGRTRFESFDEYLNFRLIDSGAFLLTGLMTFGMGLTIPPEEKDECVRLTRAAWLAAFLTNDVQSWEKEWKKEYQNQLDSNCTGEAPHMVNGVWVLMKQDSIDVQEAIARVLQKVKFFVAEFVDIVRVIHNREDLSHDARCLVEVAQYMVSGNLIWGASTPRYRPDVTLSEPQAARMTNGRSTDVAPVFRHAKDISNPVCKDANLQAVQSGHGIYCNGDAPILNANSKRNTGDSSHHHLSSNGEAMDNLNLFLVQDLPALSSLVVFSPASYISSLPSKNIRDKTADALNIWLNVSPADFAQIKCVVNQLHNASLILDDLEDGSILRRGHPAVHTVFGYAQAVNSAEYQVIEAVKEMRKLGDDCVDMCLEELNNMHIGQGHDIFWASNIICPSLEQYLTMVDYKTGGLFRILVKLMLAKTPLIPMPNMIALASLMGRYFQLRDDYMNLSSVDYTSKKGFCEDLDEGKFSLLMVHAMQVAPEADRILLQNLLAQRRAAGGMTVPQKKLVLDQMKRLGSMEYAVKVLEVVLRKMENMVKEIEKTNCIENELLHSLLDRIGVERVSA